ncbi:YqgE/AlgH family protein [Psychrosphaera aestuarii]|uniref:YqgE/AlgH family protein n=1 Tax=Psychrosphaera aestuarii TaxID=1266052 RepID=UPI001B34219C|nr:YqgE/AlgH family protein [Psychrosphaera aestuarii]
MSLKINSSLSLTNQFLIAMPSMDDGYFERTLTYICEHDENGAMGLVVNKQTDMSVRHLLSEIQIDLPESSPLQEQKVLSGGPVQVDRGFVLHNGNRLWSSSLQLKNNFVVTTSKDILENLGTDEGPLDFVVTLGYAGWGAGQLEDEIANNSWLTVNADPELIFNAPIEQRWELAVQKLGIDSSQLSHFAGHA